MADYFITLVNPSTGSVIGVLDNFDIEDMSYTRKVNDIGDFTITVRENAQVEAVLGMKDMLVRIYRTNPAGAMVEEGTFLTRYWNSLLDDNAEQITIFSGLSLEHFFKRRLIVIEDDSNAAGGFLTLQSQASNVMRDIINRQMVNPILNTGRAISGLSIDYLPDYGNIAWIRVTTAQDVVWDVLKEVAAKGGVDFRISATSNTTFVAQIGQFGVNRTVGYNMPGGAAVVFSASRENLADVEYVADSQEEVTFMYAFGQGPAEDREIVQLSGDTINDSPWNRIEGKTDARLNDETLTDGLYLAALFGLRENAELKLVTFEIPEEIAARQYRTAWDLWDYVTIEYGSHRIDHRIVSINVDVQGAEETISVVTATDEAVIGNPEVATYRPSQADFETVRSINGIIVKLNKNKRRMDQIVSVSQRAEWAGALQSVLYVDLPSPGQQIGQQFWVRDGRKPGETAGNGTGVPVHWDGFNFASDYDAQPVQV